MGAGQPSALAVAEFQSQSQPPFVAFKFQDISPPSTLYVQRDDLLIVQFASFQASETVTINGRLLVSPVGSTASVNNVIPISQTFPQAGGAFAINQATITLAEGFLLGLSATCSVASTRGQTFCRVGIQRGGGTTWLTGIPLFADYLTKNA